MLPSLRVFTLSLVVAGLASSGHAAPAIRWAFQTEGPIRGSAVVIGDTVYFGSSDGFLRAVDKSNGELRWQFATGGAIAGAPAVAGDLVIVAGRSEKVHALSASDGTEQWTFTMGATLPTPTGWNYFTAPPVVDGDRVLVASGDGHLYALDLATGEERWNYTTGDSIRAAPLVVDDTIYLASGDDYVYALTSADGALQWKFATDGVNYDLSQGFMRSDIFTRPSLRDSLLVIGSRDSKVYAIDVATHEKRWDFNYDSTWAMSTAVDADTVYVGWSTNNRINALDLATGRMRWEFTAGSHTYTTALLLGNRAYWGCADGKLYGFNKATGALEWSYRAGSQVHSSLVEADGTFYFGTDDGRLLAVAIDAPAPHKAVYLPPVPAPVQGFVIDPKLAPYLVDHGYALLDSAEALAGWLAEHTAAKEPGVVVFAFAQIPAAIIGGKPAEGPLRAYLESGGKVVWPWGMANKYTFDDQGKFAAYNPTLAAELLGVGFVGFEDSGNYFARATQTGRNWGLPAWLKTTFASLQPDAGVTPLAIDEYGRVSAWVKSFSPRIGSGWVNFSPKEFGVPMRDDELALIEHLASYTLE